MTNAKLKTWSYYTGERGVNRVRVFEHPRSSRLFIEFKECGRKVRLTLGHDDRSLAKEKADTLAAELRRPDRRPGRLTLGGLFDNYLREVTPTKGARKQQDDKRASKLFLRLLGEGTSIDTLTHREAAKYVRERRRLGDQRPGKEGKLRGTPLRPRAIAADLEVIQAALNWAVGAGWIGRNPLKGFSVNRDEGVRRPILSSDEYQKLLSVAGSAGAPSRLALVLAHETGHRIGAIRLLRWSDVDLEKATVRWRGENDKIGFEHVTPLTADAVAELQAARQDTPAIGDAWILPSPEAAGMAVSRHRVREWWKALEVAAEVARIPGRGWHSLRRQFASELKATPPRDLCELGGWKSYQTVVRCYQRADEGTMRAALAARRSLAVG